jgi:hypothetical protein
MLLNIQMLNLRQSKELLDNMKEDNILYQKKTLEDNANYDIYTKEKRTFNQCFKTRPGPAGQPGTRPTRACGRAGSKQKTGWELARPDPEGRTGTRPARPNPAETRVYFFLYSYARNDVVLAFYN